VAQDHKQKNEQYDDCETQHLLAAAIHGVIGYKGTGYREQGKETAYSAGERFLPGTL
jgi:hypothetical protein